MPTRDTTSFFLILILAVCLRTAGLTFDSLWLDESYQSMADASGQILPDFVNPQKQPFLFRFDSPHSITEVLGNFRRVDPLCPPLYAIALNRWMTLFGASDMAVRFLSVVLSAASVSIVFWLTRALATPRGAMLAALAMALSPFDIIYAQEARMYALSVFASLVSSGALLLALRPVTGKRMRACVLFVYVLSTWALINSHYTNLFVVGFQGLFGLGYCAVTRKPKLALALVAAWACVLAIWLPWFELFKQAASLRTASFYVARTPTWWWPFWALMARIPFNWIVFLAGKRVVAYAIPLYFTSVIILLCSLLATVPALKAKAGKWIKSLSSADCASGVEPRTLTVSFLWGWALVPAIAVWFIDVLESHKVVEIARYVIGTAPAIYILAGLGADFLLSAGAVARSRLGFAVLIVHAACALINNAYAHLVPQREPWAQMARLIETSCGPDDLIVVSQHYNVVCLDRYLQRPMHQIGASPALGPESLARQVGERRRFWLVTAQEGEDIKTMVPPRFKLKSQVDLHHALHLRLYED